MKITIIAGARPNFMKIAPIIRAIKRHNERGLPRITFRLIHTGQHYDDKLSRIFFKELELPEPDVNLGVGSGSQAEQTARIMIEFEKELLNNPTELVVVVGDVNSTMACAIVAKKLNTRVAHVEGGIRSFDQAMPEEINRMVTDAVSDYFFTTSAAANQNLMRAGIKPEKIFFVGNTMIDSLMFSMSRLRPPAVWEELELRKGEYLVLTLHRPSNVDDLGNLRRVLTDIETAVQGSTVVFPVHPRTRRNFDQIAAELNNIRGINPMGYFDFVYLLKNARGVVTDSGGVQEETTVLGIPCITLRTSTERPETIEEGTNELIGDDRSKLVASVDQIIKGDWKSGKIPKLWDGDASTRIIEVLSKIGLEMSFSS